MRTTGSDEVGPEGGRANGIGPGLTRRLAVAAIATSVVLGALAAPAVGAGTGGQAADSGETALVVALDEDGDADVTLRLVFDLDREAERRALERLRENRSAIAAAFEAQMRSIAADTAEETGREMRIASSDVRVSTGGSTGLVELAVTWVGLAAVEGDRLVVSDPFADGFEPAGRFVVRGPEGYALAEATPAATNRTAASATWAAGSSHEGFQAAFVPADATSTSLPGFGAPAAIVAVALVAGASALGRRRRS